jgi:hypothetical protein
MGDKLDGRARRVARTAARLTAHASGRRILTAPALTARVLVDYTAPGRRLITRIIDWVLLAAVWALIVLVAVTVAGTAIAIVIHYAGWDYIAGIGSGIGLALLAYRARSRRLRELIDWLGEDLEARKRADLVLTHRIHDARSHMP